MSKYKKKYKLAKKRREREGGGEEKERYVRARLCI